MIFVTIESIRYTVNEIKLGRLAEKEREMTPTRKRSWYFLAIVSIFGLITIIATGGGDDEGDSLNPDISGLWSFTATLISLTNGECLTDPIDIGDVTNHSVTIIADDATATLIFDDGTTPPGTVLGNTLDYSVSFDEHEGACKFTELDQAQWTFEGDTLSGTWQFTVSWEDGCTCANGTVTGRIYAVAGQRQ